MFLCFLVFVGLGWLCKSLVFQIKISSLNIVLLTSLFSFCVEVLYTVTFWTFFPINIVCIFCSWHLGTFLNIDSTKGDYLPTLPSRLWSKQRNSKSKSSGFCFFNEKHLGRGFHGSLGKIILVPLNWYENRNNWDRWSWWVFVHLYVEVTLVWFMIHVSLRNTDGLYKIKFGKVNRYRFV